MIWPRDKGFPGPAVALDGPEHRGPHTCNRTLTGNRQESSAKLTNQRISYALTTLARLVSMPVIFYLHPSSSIVILVFYLFSTGISEQHE